MSDSDNSNSETTFRYKTQSVRKKEDKKDYYGIKKRKIEDIVNSFNSNKTSENSSNLKTNISKEIDTQVNTQMPYNCAQNRQSNLKNESKKKSKNSLKLHLKKYQQYQNDLFNKTNLSNSVAEQSSKLSPLRNIDDNDTYGPVLPPNWKKSNSKSEIIGPICSPNFVLSQSELSVNLDSELQFSEITDNLKKNESDDEVIGPFPDDNKDNLSKVEIELEERALEIKLNSLTPVVKNTVRDEWMLKLPDIKEINTLGPRQFRSKEGPDMTKRSVWTDIPNSSKKDNTTKDNHDIQHIKETQKRNLEQEEIMNDYKKHKKGQKSLLQIHQQKLLKKKKTNQEKCDRRPFNRDIDLKVNTFTEEQKKSIFNKAEFLDNRFSSGASKYL